MATILQHNVGGNADTLVALMETAVRRKADVVLVQEAPKFRGSRHPAFEFLWSGRTLIAQRCDSDWTIAMEDKFTRETGGDVQVVSLGRRGCKNRVVRIVNAYFQGTGRDCRIRQAQLARWDDLLLEDCIIAGDFNAHSPMWNPACSQRRDARFLEELINTHNLQVLNDERATRPASTCHSIIDLTLATPEVANFCQDWKILDEDQEATGSDHVVIEWRWTKPASEVTKGWKIKGWALKERLDKEKQEDWPPTKPKLEVVWSLGSTERPVLDDNSTVETLEEEIDWIQNKLVQVLDDHVRRITICARSKRWWNDDIVSKRHQLSRVLRFRKTGRASQAAVKEAKKALRRSIRRSRRACWEKFLEEANGDDIWAIPRYTKPQKATAVPTISHQGAVAEDVSSKANMLVDISFPQPLNYTGDEGHSDQSGTAYQAVNGRLLQRVFQSTSTKKSPGPDGIGPLAIKCLFEWDPERIVALIRTHIRLGVHPDRWKLAKGVAIPKPGKDDYSLAKAYRVISLLNCLGKTVEKTAAILVSAHCELSGGFHPGQYGCRTRRSAVDAVGVVIAQTQEAWKRGCIVGALLMDVAAAFPSVARGCLLQKMRQRGIDECLVRWTDSFMRNRRVIMSVDGQDSEPIDVTTGLPQGSPISPVLFAIYIADIHQAVEDKTEQCRGISFVDDVTWVAEGRNLDEVVHKLERCAELSLSWAKDNAVSFETSKTEAILFTRKRKHRHCNRTIQVGSQQVKFAGEATRWLGIWLDSTLTLAENRRIRLGKARQAEARLRRIVSQYGVPPSTARTLQISIIQGTMLYAAELTWNGGKNIEGEYQKAINRMGRSTLGAFRSTPQGILAAESGLTPARALLNFRQARFAQRLYARPKDGQGPEEILDREGAALTTRLRAAAGLHRRETVEPQEWGTRKAFPGQIVIDSQQQALDIARSWTADNTLWTDGSRLQCGKVGAACAWTTPQGWTGQHFHLGSNKEVFDAEVFAIYQSLRVIDQRQETGRNYTIFVDSTSAIERIRTDCLGPGQQFAIAATEVCNRIMSRQNEVTIRWVPAHHAIQGNETADTMAKIAAEGIHAEYNVPDNYRLETSLAHMSRVASERQRIMAMDWMKDRFGNPARKYQPPKGKGLRRKLLRQTPKLIASRYYQLLSGHAAIGQYLKDRIHKIKDDKCGWCGGRKRQTRHHLFVECRAWLPYTRKMWKSIGKAHGWKHPKSPSIKWLWKERSTEAVLKMLGETRIGCISTRRAFPVESDMEGPGGTGDEGEEGGPGPP